MNWQIPAGKLTWGSADTTNDTISDTAYFDIVMDILGFNKKRKHE